jgi:hypothetical protein
MGLVPGYFRRLDTGGPVLANAPDFENASLTPAMAGHGATALTLVLLCCCRTTMLEVVEDITQRVCGAQD